MRKLENHWRSRVESGGYPFARLGPLLEYDPFQDERPLRRGDNGYRVHILQRRLQRAGGCFLQETGTFDQATEDAVRSFQRYAHLPVNGTVDGRMMRKLIDKVSYLRAEAEAAVIRRFVPSWNGHHSGTKFAYHPKEIVGMSREGKALLLFNETAGDYDTTAYLHWPGGKFSGVTLGIGYDMGKRPNTTIQADLKAINVKSDTAKAISAAAGLTGDRAQEFAKQYGQNGTKGELIHLTYDDQIALMQYLLPDYEKRVQNSVRELLLQCEFDALVSFAWNPAGMCFPNVVSSINKGQIASALQAWMHCIGTDDSVKQGLTARRKREVEFFLTGRFTKG